LTGLGKNVAAYFKQGHSTEKAFFFFEKSIKLHQEKYNANSVIPHNVLASDYLMDCHQALFFQQDTLVY